MSAGAGGSVQSPARDDSAEESDMAHVFVSYRTSDSPWTSRERHSALALR